MNDIYTWSDDMYPIVKKYFDERYASRVNFISEVAGIVKQDDLSYQIEGLGGYGEYQPYDGTNLNMSAQRRGFATVISPEQFNMTVDIHRKQAKNDLLGETRKVGQRLGYGGAMSVYMKIIRTLGGAFDGMVGGDG